MLLSQIKSLAVGGVFAAALALAACGTTTGDRLASGGLLGAGAGAAIGSLSGNAGAGAVIGGVAGAAAGALTDPCSVNLGDPIGKIGTRAETTTTGAVGVIRGNRGTDEQKHRHVLLLIVRSEWIIGQATQEA